MRHARISVAAILALVTTAPDACAWHQGDERLVDDTAHTLRSGEIRAGVLSLDVGTVRFATIGTDTLPWIAGLYLGSVLGNGHLKVRLVRTAPLTLALRGAVFYSSLHTERGDTTATGHVLLVPLTAATSSDLGRDVSLHLEVTYATLDAKGDLDVPLAGARAAIAASALQTGVMLEYRATRAVALLLLYRHQPWASPGVIRTSGEVGTGARVSLEGNVETADASTFALTGGVALSGEHANLRVGAGYGSLFFPSLGVALPGRTFVPELDFYVRF